MKNKFIYSALIILSLFLITGCNSNNKEINNQSTQDNNIEEDIQIKDETTYKYREVINSVKITINEKIYTIDLENNETVKSFVNLLPQEFNMNELNGNEKYIYLDNSLPTNYSNPKHINTGDVMLYGDNCLVIFYKSFDTSYSYTKIGHIDNLPNLGYSNITVKIEK
mgnify:CR=1 FL=1